MQVKFIQPSDPEYRSMCNLRYRVFFEAHQLPFNILFDDQEASSLHAVIPHQLQVVACGRLTPSKTGIYQVSQMAVDPAWQRQGLGRAILLALIEQAVEAHTLVLHARLAAVPFYQQFGFVPTGEIFASTKTGVPHIEMQLEMQRPLSLPS
jgi:predicted GNAT family N-acyltransferase